MIGDNKNAILQQHLMAWLNLFYNKWTDFLWNSVEPFIPFYIFERLWGLKRTIYLVPVNHTLNSYNKLTCNLLINKLRKIISKYDGYNFLIKCNGKNLRRLSDIRAVWRRIYSVYAGCVSQFSA